MAVTRHAPRFAAVGVQSPCLFGLVWRYSLAGDESLSLLEWHCCVNLGEGRDLKTK